MYFQRIVPRILTGIGISKIAQSAVMSSHEVPLLIAFSVVYYVLWPHRDFLGCFSMPFRTLYLQSRGGLVSRTTRGPHGRATFLGRLLLTDFHGLPKLSEGLKGLGVEVGV